MPISAEQAEREALEIQDALSPLLKSYGPARITQALKLICIELSAQEPEHTVVVEGAPPPFDTAIMTTSLGKFWGACAIHFDNVLKSFLHLERVGGKEIPDV